MKSKIDLLSRLLREFEAEIGTKDLDIVVLESLIDSIKALRINQYDAFVDQFKHLATFITQTEPKFGILNYQFATLKGALARLKGSKKWRKLLVKEIQDLISESKRNQGQIIKHAECIKVQNKTILIHDNSHTVHEVLIHLKNIGKRFKVVIAEQDYEKTHDNIECLHKARIPFQVIPAYMLSHVHEDIDMVFFGALTLKDSMVFVMQPGTHSVLSEFHSADVPSYMFIDTQKFSLWKSKKRTEIFTHKHTRQHYRKPIEYTRVKYSHDRVPSKFFRQIITDKGALTPADIKKVFSDRYKEYQKWFKEL